LFLSADSGEVERCDECALFKTDAEARIRYAQLIETAFQDDFMNSSECRASDRDGQWFVEVMGRTGVFHKTWEVHEVPAGSLMFTFTEI
jgi:hypothetical protein